MPEKIEVLVGTGGSVPSKWSRWEAETAYNPLRSVSHNGSGYVCKKACTGVDPETDVLAGDGVEGSCWILTAKRGKSAYEIAVENGFEGTEADYYEKLEMVPLQASAAAVNAKVAEDAAKNASASANSANNFRGIAEQFAARAVEAFTGAADANAAAQTAKNDAVHAKTAAEKAKDDAWTAKTTAEKSAEQAASAKSAAVAASNIASDAKTQAVNAQSGAETARELAETAKTAAEKAAEEAAASGGGGGVYETASGESITLTDSADAPLKGLTLYGKTVQVVQESDGSNLLDGEIERGWINYEDGSLILGGVRSANFNPVNGGAVVLMSNDMGYTNYLYEYDENKNYIGHQNRFPCTLREETRYIKISSLGEEDENDLSVQYSVVYVNLPAMDYPSYPESAGDSGSIHVQINEQTHIIPTPNGLPGIPDNTDGNYTDANGQKWYCDEIDFARGVYVQRVKKKVFDGTEETNNSGTMDGYSYRVPDIMPQYDTDELARIFCSHFSPMAYDDVDKIETAGISVFVNDYDEPSICFDASGRDIPELFAAQYAAGTPVTVWYRLAEPIETPLTEEQLAAFKAMRTAYLNTTITNDDPVGAGMEVLYAMDTKAYIDKQIAAMKSEKWTFTLVDGSTVDKEVVVR